MEAAIVFYVIVILLMIVSMWITVGKAGRPGVSQIIPIWNIIELVRIAGKPGWWVVMILLVPFANIVFLIMTYNAIAQAFGKGSGFTVGMILLPFVFWPLLAFGDAKYTAP